MSAENSSGKRNEVISFKVPQPMVELVAAPAGLSTTPASLDHELNWFSAKSTR